MRLSFRAYFALVVAWQVVLLLVLLVPRWVTAASGDTVVLKTAPVDPRDVFRGDYVILRYTISRLDLTQLRKQVQQQPLKAKETVFLVLTPTSFREQEPWRAAAVFDRLPTGAELAAFDQKAVALRGTITRRDTQFLEVDYGIESYFVPEGEGRRLEQAAGKGLAAEVRVDRRGGAIIRRLLMNGQPVSLR